MHRLWKHAGKAQGSSSPRSKQFPEKGITCQARDVSTDNDPKIWTPKRAEETAQQWQHLITQVAELSAAAGRPADAVRILPVTKNQPDQVVELLHSLGQRAFAENRVQELVRKSDLFADLGGIEWVMIGNLQRNKVRDVARYAAAFESLDSARVARALSQRMQALGAEGEDIPEVMPSLVQVNASGEEQKHGLSPADVPALLEELAALPNIDVRGFMTMAPHTNDERVIRQTFASVRNLREALAPQWEGRFNLEELSFGMSHDYPLAIEEGSTQVRLGSIIFGQRDYTLGA